MTIAEKLLAVDANTERVDALNKELETTLNGGDTGGTSYYHKFWENYLAEAKTTGVAALLFGGRGWNADTFNPPYKIDFIKNAYQLFHYSGDIPKEKLAMVDYSKITTNFNSVFANSRSTEFPRIDTRACDVLNSVFSSSSIVSVEAFILRDDGSQTLNYANFASCTALVDLTIEGVVGSNNLQLHWSTKLSKASITSVINALSTSTSGLTVTFSKTAVNNAFTTEEWNALIATKSNWTISLM